MPGGGALPLVIRPITAAETRPLRQAVLRPGQPPQDSIYPGDDDPTTVHFGAYREGGLVGIASLYAETRGGAGGSGRGWRLRGMATDAAERRAGIGRALLQACLDHVATRGGGEVWCNARIPAVDFYAGAGFEVVSERFEIAGIGPHVVMRLGLGGPGAAPAPAGPRSVLGDEEG